MQSALLCLRGACIVIFVLHSLVWKTEYLLSCLIYSGVEKLFLTFLHSYIRTRPCKTTSIMDNKAKAIAIDPSLSFEPLSTSNTLQPPPTPNYPLPIPAHKLRKAVYLYAAYLRALKEERFRTQLAQSETQTAPRLQTLAG
jgi:hypothetical protein